MEFNELAISVVKDVCKANELMHLSYKISKALGNEEQMLNDFSQFVKAHNNNMEVALRAGADREFCRYLLEIICHDFPFLRIEDNRIVFDSMVFSVCGVEK
jgi:hypothetical protein